MEATVTSLPELKAFVQHYAESNGVSELDVFEELGFFLVEPPETFDYIGTPSNSITFGQTGGDGVHYGFVGEVGPESPVVMTVPMNFENANMIVGSNLHEFLCLGCCTGYFWLEQLTYDYVETVCLLQQASDIFQGTASVPEFDDGDIKVDDPVFQSLRSRFGLKPWANVRGRLKELEAQYADSLDIAEL